MHTAKARAFFQRATISLAMTFLIGGRLLDGRGVRLFLFTGRSADATESAFPLFLGETVSSWGHFLFAGPVCTVGGPFGHQIWPICVYTHWSLKVLAGLAYWKVGGIISFR